MNLSSFSLNTLSLFGQGKLFFQKKVDVDATEIIEIAEMNIVEKDNKEPSEKETKLRIIT